MPISQKIRDLIRSAWDDGAPCLVATNGPDGPNVSVKGSMVVFDDVHTTGATFDACARTLRANGALEVMALAYARALR